MKDGEGITAVYLTTCSIAVAEKIRPVPGMLQVNSIASLRFFTAKKIERGRRKITSS